MAGAIVYFFLLMFFGLAFVTVFIVVRSKSACFKKARLEDSLAVVSSPRVEIGVRGAFLTRTAPRAVTMCRVQMRNYREALHGQPAITRLRLSLEAWSKLTERGEWEVGGSSHSPHRSSHLPRLHVSCVPNAQSLDARVHAETCMMAGCRGPQDMEGVGPDVHEQVESFTPQRHRGGAHTHSHLRAVSLSLPSVLAPCV